MNVTIEGNPTPEEVAAVVAVLSSRPAAAEAPAEQVPSRWADRAAQLRKPPSRGPGAWRHAL
jgi:hypothetical protein